MKPDPRFLNQPKLFWANVRSISQHIGYTERGTGRIKVPGLAGIAHPLNGLGLASSHVVDKHGKPTELGANLEGYFAYRAKALNGVVRTSLTNVSEARKTFKDLRARLSPRCPCRLISKRERRKARLFLLASSI